MKVLLIFSLFLIPVGGGESKRVTEYSGGQVLIKCTYKTLYTLSPKYFCRGLWSNCAYQIRAEDKNEWVTSGRFSLFDNTSAAEFWVKIGNLTVEDSGTYQCGVDVFLDFDIYTSVELTVEETTQAGSSPTQPAHLGSSSLPTGLAVFSSIGAGLVLLTAGLITVICCKLKAKSSKTRTVKSSGETDGNSKCDPACIALQPRENAYQQHANYRGLNPKTNQSDSVYQGLNPKTNQSDSVYQRLNPNTNQSDSIYQSLNPNTYQSDSVYQSLNPNTNQSDSVYQSLNPNTNQSQSAY